MQVWIVVLWYTSDTEGFFRTSCDIFYFRNRTLFCASKYPCSSKRNREKKSNRNEEQQTKRTVLGKGNIFCLQKKTRYEKREMTWTSVPLHSWTKFRSHKSHCSCVSQYFKMKKIYTISQNFQTKSAWNWTPKNNTKRWTALKVLKCWTTSDIKKDKFGYYNYSFCVLFIANVVYVLVRYLENWSFQRTNEELFLLDPMFQPDNVSIFHRIFSLI